MGCPWVTVASGEVPGCLGLRGKSSGVPGGTFPGRSWGGPWAVSRGSLGHLREVPEVPGAPCQVQGDLGHPGRLLEDVICLISEGEFALGRPKY